MFELISLRLFLVYIRNGDTKIRGMKMKFRLGTGMAHSRLDS